MKLSDAEIEKLRQSGIRLDAEGRFWHDGAVVTHGGMKAAFYRWLDRNPDGRWVLRLDDKRFVYLDVDDAPYAITSLRFEGDRIFVHLSDDTDEELAYDTVRMKDERAYADVKHRWPARFSNDAWTALGERLEEHEGTISLKANGTLYSMGTLTLPPTP